MNQIASVLPNKKKIRVEFTKKKVIVSIGDKSKSKTWDEVGAWGREFYARLLHEMGEISDWFTLDDVECITIWEFQSLCGQIEKPA